MTEGTPRPRSALEEVPPLTQRPRHSRGIVCPYLNPHTLASRVPTLKH